MKLGRFDSVLVPGRHFASPDLTPIADVQFGTHELVPATVQTCNERIGVNKNSPDLWELLGDGEIGAFARRDRTWALLDTLGREAFVRYFQCFNSDFIGVRLEARAFDLIHPGILEMPTLQPL